MFAIAGKSKHTAKQRQSTLGLSHSTAGRRKTRSHSKPREGATHENAISIDSDSDESSLGDLADASPANDVELEYPIQVRCSLLPPFHLRSPTGLTCLCCCIVIRGCKHEQHVLMAI